MLPSPLPGHQHISQKMGKASGPVMESILSLTLEIICVLTGEDAIMVKKCGEWVRPQTLIFGSRNDEKILELANKIIQLLTGEVPIRNEDIIICFSMEEWEYVEGHKDLYNDVMMQSSKALDLSESQEVPEESHIGLTTGEHCNVSEKSTDSQVTKTDYKKANHSEEHLPYPFLDGKKNVMLDEQQGLDPSKVQKTEESSTCNRIKSDLGGVLTDTNFGQSKEKQTASLEEQIFAQYPQEDLPLLHIKEEEPSSCDEDFTDVETFTVTDLDEMDNASPVNKRTEYFKGPHVTCTIGPDQEVGKMEYIQVLSDSDYAKSKIKSSQGSRNGDETFHCTYCMKSFPNATQLNLHIISHQSQKTLTCSECGECFSQKSELVTHHRVHTGEKPFACPQCGKQFPTRANVISHQATHKQPASAGTELRSHKKLDQIAQASVLCSECGMRFKNKKVLEEHQKSHKQQKMHICPVCGKGFTKRGHLSNHSRIHSGGKRNQLSESGECAPQTRKRPFLCFECGKCFPSRSHLDRHQRVHTGEKPFSCSECDKRFTDRSGLVIHERIHTGEKPYSCDDCGKCFRDRSGLVVHQRNHTGQQPFRCLECGKCFHNRARLERHEHNHKEEKSYSCPKCNQSFTSVSALTIHYRGHFGEQPSDQTAENDTSQSHPQGQQKHLGNEKSLACSECGKGFKELSTLTAHYMTHIAEQRHIHHEERLTSVKCEKSFLDRTSFIAHKKQHNGEKPYKCPKCGECFVLKGYLTKHLETHA